LHHGFLCAHCYECNVIYGHPLGRWDVCTHIKGYLQLKDGVVQVMFETLWKIGEDNQKVRKMGWIVNVLRWNLEIEPFVLCWVVQTKKNTRGLGAIKDHMLPSNVAKKGRCCCWFMLRLQEGMNVDQP
jgi:hypothetical protein